LCDSCRLGVSGLRQVVFRPESPHSNRATASDSYSMIRRFLNRANLSPDIYALSGRAWRNGYAESWFNHSYWPLFRRPPCSEPTVFPTGKSFDLSECSNVCYPRSMGDTNKSTWNCYQCGASNPWPPASEVTVHEMFGRQSFRQSLEAVLKGLLEGAGQRTGPRQRVLACSNCGQPNTLEIAE
jgi:hypothetical protein